MDGSTIALQRSKTLAALGITPKIQKSGTSDSLFNYNEKLIEGLYDAGTVYEEVTNADAYKKVSREWRPRDGKVRPYLEYVKKLSEDWPQLKLLADFMDCGTVPGRWKNLRQFEQEQTGAVDPRRGSVAPLPTTQDNIASPNPLRRLGRKKSEPKERLDARFSRAHRYGKTNVKQIVYYNDDSKEPETKAYTDVDALRPDLLGKLPRSRGHDPVLRLFVVEDLSTDVIEALGANLKIDPSFFRAHIVHYAWYNLRDRWVDPHMLEMDAQGKDWYSFRFVTARYFDNKEELKQAHNQADLFNVYRRIDDDQNKSKKFDDEHAIVGTMRNRASLWFRGATDDSEASAVLLLDPTVTRGYPLWYGYRNWQEIPEFDPTKDLDDYVTGFRPQSETLFEDVVHWATKEHRMFRPQQASPLGLQGITIPKIHIPLQIILRMICSEWLTLAEFVKTRLNQIDWEISYPTHFLKDYVHDPNYIDKPYVKLHLWRRLVPQFREMISELQHKIAIFQCDTYVPQGGIFKNGAIGSFYHELERLLEQMDENQKRIDRLTSVVTAAITINDSRRGLEENKNLQRLTWLGTLFLPLSFIATLFSMQDDISAATWRRYFASAIPVTLVCALGVYLANYISKARQYGRKTKEKAKAKKDSLKAEKEQKNRPRSNSFWQRFRGPEPQKQTSWQTETMLEDMRRAENGTGQV